jgi:hypothetical protein
LLIDKPAGKNKWHFHLSLPARSLKKPPALIQDTSQAIGTALAKRNMRLDKKTEQSYRAVTTPASSSFSIFGSEYLG